LATLGFILLVSLLLALLLSSNLQRVISVPVLRLAHTAQAVSRCQDYSLRAEAIGEDELGQTG
jgi:methyl-accepting chemotaxis protein